jgi:hypothetical protein
MHCGGGTPMCNRGCQAPTCAPACGVANICCVVPGPGPEAPPMCLAGPTCPVGCPACK